jgi:hypothetical protein
MGKKIIKFNAERDALWTIHNSAIDYLYLPELKVLVSKESN